MLRKGYPVTNVYLFKNRLWLDEFSTRMHDWMKGNKRPPIKIDAELHRRCNLKCKFCSRRNSERNENERSKEFEVSKERWVEIAEQSGKLGVRSWNISGVCEPMCKPDLTLSVMRKLKEYNVFGEMTTNGTLWTEDMVRETVEMGWDSVCVSLDSPDKETHNKLRQGKAFEKAIKTLQLFKKWKDKLDSKKPTMTINVVLNKENYDQMEEMFLLADDLNVNSVFIEPMIVYNREGENLKLGEEETREFKKIAEKCEELGKKLNIEPNINVYTEDKEFQEDLVEKTSEMKEVIDEDSEERVEEFKDEDKTYSDLTERILDIPCYYPWFYMIITGDGSVSPCGEMEEKKENIKEKDLKEIWYGKEFESEREKFLEQGLADYCDMCRPNVVGDARRIRKSIIELRDEEYLRNAISEVEYVNKNLEEKIELLQRDETHKFSQCGENCRHKRELEEIKESTLYKLASKISENKIGGKIKNEFHKFLGSELSEDIEKESKNVSELREMLMKRIKKNKELKDDLNEIKQNKNINRNMDDVCEYKRELIEIRSSLISKVME